MAPTGNTDTQPWQLSEVAMRLAPRTRGRGFLRDRRLRGNRGVLFRRWRSGTKSPPLPLWGGRTRRGHSPAPRRPVRAVATAPANRVSTQRAAERSNSAAAKSRRGPFRGAAAAITAPTTTFLKSNCAKFRDDTLTRRAARVCGLVDSIAERKSGRTRMDWLRRPAAGRLHAVHDAVPRSPLCAIPVSEISSAIRRRRSPATAGSPRSSRNGRRHRRKCRRAPIARTSYHRREKSGQVTPS